MTRLLLPSWLVIGPRAAAARRSRVVSWCTTTLTMEINPSWSRIRITPTISREIAKENWILLYYHEEIVHWMRLQNEFCLGATLSCQVTTCFWGLIWLMSQPWVSFLLISAKTYIDMPIPTRLFLLTTTVPFFWSALLPKRRKPSLLGVHGLECSLFCHFGLFPIFLKANPMREKCSILGEWNARKCFLLNLSNVIRIVGHVIFITFCGVLFVRSEWWNLTKCSLFFVTMKSFTSRATVRKTWLFFHNVLWCLSDLQTLVHNKTLSANFFM